MDKKYNIKQYIRLNSNLNVNEIVIGKMSMHLKFSATLYLKDALKLSETFSPF